MKKFLSILLAVVMCALLAAPALAADNSDSALKFHDGEFRIMQLNDTQDVILKDVLEQKLLKAAVEKEQPDLIVFAGDQLTDFFPGANKAALIKCLDNFFPFVDSLGVPWVVTFGNHDHDWDKKGVFTLEEQIAYYQQYENCVIPDDGHDVGTYNLPILSTDGRKIAFNVYALDSNNKAPDGVLTGYEGLHADQVQWYKDKRDELQAANGGKVVPSLVFQHVPMKEIYQFLDEIPFTDDLSNAVYSLDENKWYVANDKVIDGVLGEIPCSESLNSNTGEYEAMTEKGDVVGAFFGHDHVNNFVGVTSEGLKMGYNGGTGFSTYGRNGDRSVRTFVISEDDPANYETHITTYNDVVSPMSFWILDPFSPVAVTVIFKFLVSLIPGFAMEILRMYI